MLKYITIGAVLSAAFLWSYATDDRIISFIEKDLTTQLNAVAPKTPNGLFDYVVAGRDVIIRIREFGREDEIDTLQRQIASVGGVDNIFLVGSVANPATAPAIAALSRSGSNKLFVEIQIDNNVLTVTGNASAPEATETVLQKLRDSKGTEVNNYLDFYPGIPSSQWLNDLKIITSRLPTAGTLLITESGVSRHGGIFGNARIPDSSRAPLQIAEAETAAAAETAAEEAETAAATEAEAAAAAEAELADQNVRLQNEVAKYKTRITELSSVTENINTGEQSAAVSTVTAGNTLAEMRDKLAKQLVDAGASGLSARLTEGDNALGISLGSSRLFEADGVALSREGSEMLRKVAGVLQKYPDWQIDIQGHTDSQPVADNLLERFASNSELSTAKADIVRTYFTVASNIDPDLMSVNGFAATKPVADNATREGRILNRRVDIVLREPGAL